MCAPLLSLTSPHSSLLSLRRSPRKRALKGNRSAGGGGGGGCGPRAKRQEIRLGPSQPLSVEFLVDFYSNKVGKQAIILIISLDLL